MADPATSLHHQRRHRVVAVPYPGRGHINPMMNFCKLLASKRPDVQILIIVTEEWFGYLNSDNDDILESHSSTRSISFTTIPNIVPSEEIRGHDLAGFLEAVQTEMEGPVEQALDAIGAPQDLIIADSFLGWAVDLGRRRHTRVASFWPASVTTFLLVHHYSLIQKLLAESASKERIEISGICSIRKVDLLGSPQPDNKRMAEVVVKAVSSAIKAECIIFRSLNELEAPAIHALKADLSCPMFTIGPAIPYFKRSLEHSESNYICWLDSQKERSVLYVSLGSFMSASSSQMDELAAGLKASGVPFLWVGRNQTCELSNVIEDKGMLVPWCDQMRVLCHPSAGGFLTHCGWNSTVETAFARVPALTFPLGAEQVLNSKLIVEDWRIGWRMKDRVDELVGRDAVSALLKRFMDLKCSERKELDRSSKELQARLLESVGEDGSTSSLNRFLSQMIQEESEMADD